MGDNGLGQTPSSLADLVSRIPGGAVNVVLRTPVGVAIVDPFAAAQDPNTQAVMQALGIQVEIVFGPVSPADLEAPRLSENLKTAGLVLGGLGILWLVSRARR